MAKQILIDETLFVELVRFHCLEVYDDQTMNQHIKEQLENKLNKMCARINYTKKLNENNSEVLNYDKRTDRTKD